MYTATANARTPTKPTVANLPWLIATQTASGHTAMVATANMYLPSGLERAFTRSMVSVRTTQRQLGPSKFLDALARHNRYPSRCLPSFFERADLGDHGLPAHISQVLVADRGPHHRRRGCRLRDDAFPDARISVHYPNVRCHAERHVGHRGISEQPFLTGTRQFVCWPGDQRTSGGARCRPAQSSYFARRTPQ